jgi:predicted MarR family transcription regulator
LAEADLDVVIRSIAKLQNKSLMQAARKRQDRFMTLAAKAKDKETKARYKQIAKDTLLYASAAARRLHVTADNAADSYARSMKKAAEQALAKTPVKKKKS